MNQPWLLKAVAFQILRLLPDDVYHFLTTKVTKRSGKKKLYSETGEPTNYYRKAQKHAANLSKRIDSTCDLVLEFGAGKDLLSNLLLHHFGFQNQLTVDLNPRVRAIYLNSIRKQLPADAIAFVRFTDDYLSELKQLGISYRAPFDMRKCDLQANSVAAVISTNTLEHIPEADIQKILKECYRLLRTEGVCSFKIDYSDHYAHTDRHISKFNFLKYSDFVWHLLSPPDHFQNRLRHCDYAKMFIDSGFRILEEERTVATDAMMQLSSLKLAKRFSGYSKEELAPTSGWFVLKKQ